MRLRPASRQTPMGATWRRGRRCTPEWRRPETTRVQKSWSILAFPRISVNMRPCRPVGDNSGEPVSRTPPNWPFLAAKTPFSTGSGWLGQRLSGRPCHPPEESSTKATFSAVGLAHAPPVRGSSQVGNAPGGGMPHERATLWPSPHGRFHRRFKWKKPGRRPLELNALVMSPSGAAAGPGVPPRAPAPCVPSRPTSRRPVKGGP